MGTTYVYFMNAKYINYYYATPYLLMIVLH